VQATGDDEVAYRARRNGEETFTKRDVVILVGMRGSISVRPCSLVLLALAPTVIVSSARAEAPLDTNATVATVAPRYPRSVIARPLTLPASVFAIGADSGANHDLSAISAAPIVGWGITEKLEVQMPYSFALHDFEARGSVTADAGYAIVRGALGGKLEMVARIRGTYDTLGTAAAPLGVGVHVQYNLTPHLALISGAPGTQQLRISVASDAEMHMPIDLALPLGVGIQATETIYVQLDTRLVQLALSDSETLAIGRDMVPLSVTAVWNAVPALDVQAAVATDLTSEPRNTLTFLVGARFYAGRL
jgi:hypothetical protein